MVVVEWGKARDEVSLFWVVGSGCRLWDGDACGGH